MKFSGKFSPYGRACPTEENPSKTRAELDLRARSIHRICYAPYKVMVWTDHTSLHSSVFSASFLYPKYPCQVRPIWRSATSSLVTAYKRAMGPVFVLPRKWLVSVCRLGGSAGNRPTIIVTMTQRASNEIQVIPPRQACRPRKNTPKEPSKSDENPGFDKALIFFHKRRFAPNLSRRKPERHLHYSCGEIRESECFKFEKHRLRKLQPR